MSEEYRNRGRTRFPPDRARTSFVRGLALERDGDAKGRPMGSMDPERPNNDQSQLRWWAGAAEAYVQALQADPAYSPATLHLGRIRMLQGNRTEATRLFQEATRADDGRVSCLAALFLGSLAERDGNFEEAELHYRDGLRRWPPGQSAPVALSQLLSRMGREAEARAVLFELLTSSRGGLVEPLWTYLPPFRMQVGDFLAAFVELRVEALR